MKARRLLALLISSLLTPCAAQAQEDLTDLDLATLMSMDVTVTSAAKRAQASADAAAAVFVITRDDIRRSGATSLPEVLRMAPGLQVARIDARSWAITARGFNSRFANKLQVLVDGRSIYTPLFSGVMWEEQTVPLYNIQRIEVMRGPGGALWGINAVNGVINIITRTAADSAGLRVQAGGGTVDSESGAMSYSDRIDALGDYRVYAEHAHTQSYLNGGEPWVRTQAGWRLDRAAAGGQLSFQGDVQQGDFGDIDGYADSNLPGSSRTGNVTVNWQRDVTLGRIDAHTYYSWADRGMPGRWSEATAGLDLQLSANRIGRHLLTGGFGLRQLEEEQRDPATQVRFSKTRSTQDQWNIYAQDEINFFDDRLRVIAGAKLEDFTFTGLAFQPTLRALWRFSPTQTIWGAVSRAVRTPSRIELFSHVKVDVPRDVLVRFVLSGNEHLDAEKLNAYELGWRWRPNSVLALDASLYYNEYKDLISVIDVETAFVPGPPPRIDRLFAYTNAHDTTVYGVETSLEWAAADWLRWQLNGNWYRMTETPSAAELLLQAASDPSRSFGTRARIDLPYHTELDVSWRYVGSLSTYDIPSYTSFDLRAGWHVRENLELSLMVNNAFDDDHIEFYDETGGAMGARIGRSFFGRFVWRLGR
ncbi:TonB-dependent receptor plug domain-containing protein [Peristeroidobacter agariperforans]|uniref:TonB-dependent receptor plug domain-containing protein n=1 Tax=Peristeroidobacter agariperforans TaxID=268404 RepID=UPI00101D1454|nr:TonB-dependent receptor [Peristeroidobacter agariperforans]